MGLHIERRPERVPMYPPCTCLHSEPCTRHERMMPWWALCGLGVAALAVGAALIAGALTRTPSVLRPAHAGQAALIAEVSQCAWTAHGLGGDTYHARQYLQACERRVLRRIAREGARP